MAWHLGVSVVAGYLLGSISFGYLMGHLYGVDVRKYGSGGTGATNVLRTVGRVPAAITTIGDAAKGFVACYLAGRFLTQGDQWAVVLAGAGALLGHAYPIWLRFKGGKSVATGAGVLLYLAWQLVAVALVVFAVVIAISRYVSLGSILAALTALVGVWAVPYSLSVRAIVTVAAAVIIWRHRENVQRLRAGKENKLGHKAKPRESQ